MSGVTVFHGGSYRNGVSTMSGRHVVRLASTPARRVQAPTSQAPLRLTRRGRAVLIGLPLLLLAALLLSLAGFVLSPAKASDSAHDLSVTPTVSVVVQPGSSLWGIASAVAPERDPREVVAEIVQLNNLPGGTVVAGQQLFVPADQG